MRKLESPLLQDLADGRNLDVEQRQELYNAGLTEICQGLCDICQKPQTNCYGRFKK